MSKLKEYIRSHMHVIMVLPVIIWVAIFLFGPLLIIGTFSFYTNTTLGYLPQLTLDNYVKLITEPIYRSIFISTIYNAGLITIISLFVGYPAAYYLAFKIKNDNTRLLLVLVLIIPFWVDFTTKLMAWFPILGTNGIINYSLLSLGIINEPTSLFILSPTAATIVMLQTYMLFMIAPILLGLGNVDYDIYNAAETLGASRLQIFRHITLPLSRPGIVIGSSFVFVMTMGDFVTPRVLGGSMQTIGILVAMQSSLLNWPLASALATVIIIITLIVVLTLFKIVNVGKLVF